MKKDLAVIAQNVTALRSAWGYSDFSDAEVIDGLLLVIAQRLSQRHQVALRAWLRGDKTLFDLLMATA